MASTFLDALAGTRLYPLTDRKLSGLSHAEQVAELSDCGVTLVQLREKNLSPLEFYSEATEAIDIAQIRGIKIIINDRVDLTLALKADGVHLGQDDLPVEVARRILGPKSIIGLSTHNLEQAQVAAGMSVDYIAIGPIFQTNTKQGPDPPVGLSGLRLVRKAIGHIPLVAIGGITGKNSKDVLDAGADSISVISDLWMPTGKVCRQIGQLLRHP